MLTVGRVGLDATVRLREVQRSASGRGDVVRLTGNFRGASLAETKVLRQEISALAAMRHTVIPVTYSIDSDLDGYYRLLTARVDAAASQGSLQDRGYLPYDLRLERVGSEADVAMQSVITGAVRQNDFSYTSAGVDPSFALPPGYDAPDFGASLPASILRATPDGQTRVYIDVASGSVGWSIGPSNYYLAGSKIDVGGYTRAGLTCPNTPTDWQLSNGLVRVRPVSGTSRILVDYYGGTAWESAKTWMIGYDSSGTLIEVDAWRHIAILRNDAAATAIRLTGQTLSTGRRWTVDLLVRRGMRYVEATVATTAPMDIVVSKLTAEAATSGTGYIYASANDADGNRYVLGSPTSFVADLTQGGIVRQSAMSMQVMIGVEINGTAQSEPNEWKDAIYRQYLGYVGERVVPVRR